MPSIANIWGKLRNLNDAGLLDTLLLLGGNLIWVDGASGDDLGYGTKDSPVKTLLEAYTRARDGKHDIIVIKNTGNSASECTVRVDAAFTWAKECVHLVSQTPVMTMFSPRARLAPSSGTTAFAAFFTLSGNNCLFHNIQFWGGFTVGVANSKALTITGQRNMFVGCHIAGLADAASAADAGSRCLLINGGGENLFLDCVIGVDTVTRSAANASIEFAGATARNVFKRCIFPFFAGATSPLLVKTAAAGAMDRFQLFEECVMWNMGGSTIAGLCTLVAASGGYLIFVRPSVIRAITGFGTDAGSRTQTYITGPTDGNTVSGVGYNPNA